MRTQGHTRGLLALAVLAALGSVGCGRELKGTLVPNQPPTVRLTYAPIDTTHAEFYTYRMNWIGYDSDGRVVRFEYVVDPPTQVGAVIPWVRTTNNEEVITFRATTPVDLHAVQPRSRDFHVFMIRSVDDKGAASEPVVRAFYSFGVAPTVGITAPRPSNLIIPRVTPAVRIAWTGHDYIDPNGYVFERPLQYKFKLYKRSQTPQYDSWLADPDSLRREVAPVFAGWDSCGGDTTEVQFTGLVPDNEYLFVIVAFGRSGAYTPVFDLNANMLAMRVGFAGFLGPRLTLYNSFFSYTYPGGGWPSPLDPAWAIPLQVPSGLPITFNWFAEPPEGSIMKRYRWVLDLINLDDETPRTDQNDWYHWSPWSLATSATIGPFAGATGDSGEVHNFYVVAEDINDLQSLGWVQFRVFKPAFDRELLVVNDTRYRVDERSFTQPPGRTDSLKAPIGNWPTRAELDTFLFARGGVRWKMTPDGMLSTPGVFAGYSYDTLGTRYGLTNPTIPLNVLGQYKHIIWMTDALGSTNAGAANSQKPITALAYMSDRNRQNTLSTWVGQGGRLWALGGGFANATNTFWNNGNNDLNAARVYTSIGARPDLVPGRFMFDLAHWRSEIRIAGPLFTRFARFDLPDPLGGPWHGGVFRNTIPGASYTLLPERLLPKAPTTDPMYPYRTQPQFYINNPQYTTVGAQVEFMTLENYIYEYAPSPSNPDVMIEFSALDTLYLGYGAYPLLPGNQGVNPIMTYYHGLENTELLYTGADLWTHRRQDCVALVDFVLNRMWGLQRSAPSVPGAVASRAGRPAPAAAATTTPTVTGGARPTWKPAGTLPARRWR